MSRPLKLKVTGAVLRSAFQLPDLGLLGLFAGAHRRRFGPPRRRSMLFPLAIFPEPSVLASAQRGYVLPPKKAWRHGLIYLKFSCERSEVGPR